MELFFANQVANVATNESDRNKSPPAAEPGQNSFGDVQQPQQCVAPMPIRTDDLPFKRQLLKSDLSKIKKEITAVVENLNELEGELEFEEEDDRCPIL